MPFVVSPGLPLAPFDFLVCPGISTTIILADIGRRITPHHQQKQVPRSSTGLAKKSSKTKPQTEELQTCCALIDDGVSPAAKVVLEPHLGGELADRADVVQHGDVAISVTEPQLGHRAGRPPSIDDHVDEHDSTSD